MIPFLDRLRQRRVLVADGAMGTLLFARGLRTGECPEAVALSRPEILEEIASAYLDAGAEIIQTNTFGGSPLKLAGYGLDGRAEEINGAAVEAVRRAVGSRAYVSGSLGPTGRLLRPHGDTEPAVVLDAYERQARALAGAGVDLFCVETMIDLTEARLAVQAARSISPGTPIVATMTFDETPRGFFTVMGVSVEAAIEGLVDAGADVVGSNCGNGIEKMVEIASVFRRSTERPLAFQANAGLPTIVGGEAIHPETPEFFAEKAARFLDLGVAIVGGCCGTTPDHIRALCRRARGIGAR